LTKYVCKEDIVVVELISQKCPTQNDPQAISHELLSTKYD